MISPVIDLGQVAFEAWQRSLDDPSNDYSWTEISPMEQQAWRDAVAAVLALPS